MKVARRHFAIDDTVAACKRYRRSYSPRVEVKSEKSGQSGPKHHRVSCSIRVLLYQAGGAAGDGAMGESW